METANTVPEEIEEESTVPVPNETNRELVYGSHLFGDEEIPCAPFGVSGMY